jgi:predicted transport protein
MLVDRPLADAGCFELEQFCEGLGDDITKKVLKFYFAFRGLKNFACVEVHPQKKTLLVYVKVSPDDIDLKPGFSRDVRRIGHLAQATLNSRSQTAPTLMRRSH